jgi:3-hydroxy acid dehydrogenase / malonic semialdehyde reductase
LICITGASSGIGAATAELLSSRGHPVFLGARRVDKLKKLRLSKNASFCELDVTNPQSCAAFFDQAMAQSDGAITALINNAGLAKGVDHVDCAKIEDWQSMIETNLLAVLRLTQLFLPQFKKQKCGDIVMLSSIAAHEPYAGGAVYAATKHALRAVSKSLRMELVDSGVRVMTIDPGLVETEFSMVRFNQDNERAKKVYQGLTPLNAQDIAECIEFALSRPRHVNIDQMIVMPQAQASVHVIHRENSAL